MNRRSFLSTSALVAAGTTLALAGCTAGSTAATISAQVLADVQGLVPETQAIVAAITQYAPNAITSGTISQINTLEAAAMAGLKSLVPSLSAAAGASTLQTVDNYLNAALQAIGAALPAASIAFPVLMPFVGVYDAAVALLPGVEAWVNSIITPTVASAPVPLRPVKAKFTPDEARAILKIATVGK